VIYNLGGGIEEDSAEIANNIISQVPQGHLFIASNNNVHDNLLWQNGGAINVQGTCSNCIQADPQFVNPANGDFRLLNGSPAIDSGIDNNVYQTFYNLYGIDIKKDIENNVRPMDGDNDGTADWDIGAYEYLGGTPDPTPTPTPTVTPTPTPPPCISTQELLQDITQWKQGSSTIEYLVGRIVTWKNQVGCP